MAALDLLKKLPEAFNPEAAAGTDCIVQFALQTPAYVTLKDGICTLSEGTSENADVSLEIADEDLVALLKGELNGMTAFMTGKLQLDGDMMLAQRFMGFFDPTKLD
ncbi:MAG: SCP2 sterol-binding domain-containing protein [Sinobacteraceae bacterium]|nr:SCP2 sterol-binding domain-containing protein [Nevskiaceae bacterium]